MSGSNECSFVSKGSDPAAWEANECTTAGAIVSHVTSIGACIVYMLQFVAAMVLSESSCVVVSPYLAAGFHFAVLLSLVGAYMGGVGWVSFSQFAFLGLRYRDVVFYPVMLTVQLFTGTKLPPRFEFGFVTVLGTGWSIISVVQLHRIGASSAYAEVLDSEHRTTHPLDYVLAALLTPATVGMYITYW